MAVPLSNAAERDQNADEEAVVEVGYSQIHDSYSESDNEAEGIIHVDDDGNNRGGRGRNIDSESIPAQNSTHVIHINGMEIYVHGQLEGMEQALNYYSDEQVIVLNPNHGQQTLVCDNLQTMNHSFGQTLNFNINDVGQACGGGDEEMQEGEGGGGKERERERERELGRPNETLRRAAPLPAARCETIKNAMQRISLGGFRPHWADQIPEDQWISCLKNRRNLSSQLL